MWHIIQIPNLYRFIYKYEHDTYMYLTLSWFSTQLTLYVCYGGVRYASQLAVHQRGLAVHLQLGPSQSGLARRGGLFRLELQW